MSLDFAKMLSSSAKTFGPPRVRLAASNEAYPTAVYASGEDIICPCGVATSFGGPWDHSDDGRTASGRNTKREPNIIGCALPMPGSRFCSGTPIPQLPWGTPVLVRLGAVQITASLIDVGPHRSLKSRAIIDLTWRAWENLLGQDVGEELFNNLERMVSFQILGTVHLLAGYVPYQHDVGTVLENGKIV